MWRRLLQEVSSRYVQGRVRRILCLLSSGSALGAARLRPALCREALTPLVHDAIWELCLKRQA
ncbi:uncharacterized protein V6R79_009780 [Siganus canaliculatus]